MLRRSSTLCVSLFAAAAFLHAQGLKPKEKAADYPAHAELKDGFTMGAEYLVHTLPTVNRAGAAAGALVANDYLVVEIGVFGPRFSRIDVLAGTFELRVTPIKTNQKTTLTPDSPGTVAGSIKYSDWTPKPRVEASAGAGNASVVIGPPITSRFPGDPSVRPLPPSPVPEQNPAGIEKEPPVSIDEQVQRASLPTGELAPPAAGLIFFPFDGKTKSIKTLELIYEGPAGKVVLKLE